jgi:hypothetical protein
MADQNFVDFEFAVTDGTTDRTLPDRLSDKANVRDWGATGDGVTDDWLAIQSAIDRNSVDLTVAAVSTFVPTDAVRATVTATRTGSAITALTIGVNGDNYVPLQIYNITFSGGGGTGATGTATATAGGVINQASLSLTGAGTGYTSTPTTKIEYPGHVTTLTFDSVPSDLTSYDARIYVVSPGTAVIRGHTVVTSVNTGAGTAILTGDNDTSVTEVSDNTAVVLTADLQIGDVVRFCKANVGTVYVPPGTYRVSQPVDFSGFDRTFHFHGDGNISKLIGDFDDYVIKRQTSTPTARAQSGLRRVERFYVENEHATGGGIIMANCVGGSIYDCSVVANRGIKTMNQDEAYNSAAYGSFEMVVSNCDLTPGTGNRAGSLGLALFHDGPTLNCRVIDYETGWIHMGGQGGQIVTGCYFETCDTGCWANILPDLATNGAAHEHAIIGNYFKDCGTAIRNPNYTTCGNYITAAEGAITGDPQYGIRINDDKSLPVILGGNYVTGWYDVASISIGGTASNSQRGMYVSNYAATNTKGGGTTWTAVANAVTGEFIECGRAATYLFSKLPPDTVVVNRDNRIEGYTYNITDGSTATWGATCAGSGANHVKIRWNNTNWTVVGK